MVTRTTILMLLLTLLLTTGCSLTVAPPTPDPQPEIPQPEINANGVIFSLAQTEASLDAIGRSITGTWVPTAEDVARLEADLPAFLQSAKHDWLRPDPPISTRAPHYMRQYLGIVEAGEQLIYANFFCSTHDDEWREEFVFVMDGGDCYFQLKYNPQTREFSDFTVNGEA